jgi:hypothetical protein
MFGGDVLPAQFSFGCMSGLLALGALASGVIGSTAFPWPVPLTAGAAPGSFASGVLVAASADVVRRELKIAAENIDLRIAASSPESNAGNEAWFQLGDRPDPPHPAPDLDIPHQAA